MKFQPSLNKTLCPNPPPPDRRLSKHSILYKITKLGLLSPPPTSKWKSKSMFSLPGERSRATALEVGIANHQATNVLSIASRFNIKHQTSNCRSEKLLRLDFPEAMQHNTAPFPPYWNPSPKMHMQFQQTLISLTKWSQDFNRIIHTRNSFFDGHPNFSHLNFPTTIPPNLWPCDHDLHTAPTPLLPNHFLFSSSRKI